MSKFGCISLMSNVDFEMFKYEFKVDVLRNNLDANLRNYFLLKLIQTKSSN